MEHHSEKQENNAPDYFLPFSIIVAAAMIAGAWIYTSGLEKSPAENKIAENGTNEINAGAENIENIKAIAANDHIFGNPNASIKIVEFSDMECPFCKRFHSDMKKIIGDYPGKVAWIYRHYPLDQLHSKARKSAEAAECANELGGNEKFWVYLDGYFEVTPSNDQINLSQLPVIADKIGLDKAKFETCVNSGKYSAHVEENFKDALNSGARGTPYSIVIAPDGKKYPVSGALPEQIRLVIDQAL
ncbi:DsbA family protein [Candidatus Wolfebacteria bacterium]|nr:DsbA family protein [Candidatus Wolfebacteria bacterium]